MRRFFLFAILLTTITLSACAPAEPATTAEDGISINNVWSRPAMSEGNGAVYFEITNNNGAADTLVSVESNAANVIEIHETIMENEVMKMQPLADGLPLPAGEAVSLEPGGKHIMLIGLTSELVEGESIALTLNFANAEPVTIEAEVRSQMSGGMGN